MKTSFLILFSFFSIQFFSGCATPQTANGVGVLHTDSYEGILVTANQTGKKRGTACTKNILGLFISGDASIAAAMKEGGISIVSHVDRSYKNIIGVYSKTCTIVTGN